jgi:DNA polymerase-3 subunit delta
MKYSELLIQIGQGKIRPVYLFHGEEGFLMEEAISKLKKAILAPGFEDFNYHLLAGPSAGPAEIIHLCQTLPFFSGSPHQMKRLVVVRDVEVLSGSEALIPYLDNASSTTCLVLVARKLDQRKRLFSALMAKGAEVAFNTLNDSQVKIWIKEATRSMGIVFSPEAVVYFQEVLGHDLYQIRNELERIFLTVGPGAVGVQEVQALLMGERGHTVFEWLDALRRRDPEKAIRLLVFLLDSGEHPLSLLGLFLSSLRRAIRLADSGHKGSPSPAWGDVDLNKALNLCLEADSRLKGSRLAPHLILEGLILSICGKGSRSEIKIGAGLSGRLSSRTGFLP